MKKSFYVVKLGGNLYMSGAPGLYRFYQSSCSDPMKATHFSSYEQAEAACRKTIGGRVEEYVLFDAETYQYEIESLNAANIELSRQKNELEKNVIELKKQLNEK